MAMDTLSYHIMPEDAGQIVEIAYAVDWESELLYRRTTDGAVPVGHPDRVAIQRTTITDGDGEFEPQNGVLPEHDRWVKKENTIMTYYAVCNANGPISVRLDSATLEAALEEFDDADVRAWIDDPRLDAEDDFGIYGTGMSESEFADALEAESLVCVHDANPIINAHAGTVAHLADGWTLWCDGRS